MFNSVTTNTQLSPSNSEYIGTNSTPQNAPATQLAGRDVELGSTGRSPSPSLSPRNRPSNLYTAPVFEQQLQSSMPKLAPVINPTIVTSGAISATSGQPKLSQLPLRTGATAPSRHVSTDTIESILNGSQRPLRNQGYPDASQCYEVGTDTIEAILNGTQRPVRNRAQAPKPQFRGTLAAPLNETQTPAKSIERQTQDEINALIDARHPYVNHALLEACQSAINLPIGRPAQVQTGIHIDQQTAVQQQAHTANRINANNTVSHHGLPNRRSNTCVKATGAVACIFVGVFVGYQVLSLFV
jgi:hypothetical protein